MSKLTEADTKMMECFGTRVKSILSAGVYHYFVEFETPVTWQQAKLVLKHAGTLYPVRIGGFRGMDKLIFSTIAAALAKMTADGQIVANEGPAEPPLLETRLGSIRPRSLMFTDDEPETSTAELRRLRTERARELGAGAKNM